MAYGLGRASLLLLGVLSSALAACGSDDGGGSPAGTGGAAGAAGSGGAGGAIDGPPAEGPITSLDVKWNEMAPGGATTCARGGPFKFWVRPGKVNRVVVEFRGGGACWNAITCFPDAALFEEDANPEPWMSDDAKAVGIYNHARADNPFKDWHHLYIAYCTGDVHWGNAKQTYGAGSPLASTVEHKGAVNVKAALDWLYTNVPSPDKALVTGCSAGGYGAAFWAGAVLEHYKDAKVYQFADSAAGIITDSFFQESFPAWNAKESFPKLTGVDPATFQALPELYIGLGKTYPASFFSQFNTAFDATQTKYFVAMGGKDANEWSSKMQANIAQITADAPGFRSFMGAGYDHCVIDKDTFYTAEVGGTKVVDWLKDAVSDKSPASVSCKDSDCGSPKPQ